MKLRPSEPDPTAAVFQVGHLVLDGVRFELRNGEQRLAVQPKVLQLLLHLAAARQRPVSIEELLRVLWSDAQVTPASVKRAICGARKALGDDGGTQSSIRTVRGRGYQLVLPVSITRYIDNASAPSVRSRRPRRIHVAPLAPGLAPAPDPPRAPGLPVSRPRRIHGPGWMRIPPPPHRPLRDPLGHDPAAKWIRLGAPLKCRARAARPIQRG